MPPRKTFRLETHSKEHVEPFRTLKSLREIDLRGEGGFRGRYRLYRATWVAEARDMVRRRKLYCWLFDGPLVVGTFKAYEFDTGYIYDDDFCMVMDDESNSFMELADIATHFWPEIFDSIFCHGTLVYIDRLAVIPGHARNSEWAGIMRRIIEIEYPNRAVLALKAFPTDYEKLEHNEGLDIRQRALIRLYRRELSVRPFPGRAGREGWLYAITPRFKDDIPEPVEL